MRINLSENEAIEIANNYKSKYSRFLEGKAMHYELVTCRFIPHNNNFSNDPIWEIFFDVQGWDDIWYSIIVSDSQKEVLCCSNMWYPLFYPHIKNSHR